MIKCVKFGESQLFFCYSSCVNTIVSFSEVTLLRGQSEGRVLKARYKKISFLFKNKTFRITSYGFQHFYMGVHFIYSKFSFLSAPMRCLSAVGMDIKYCFVFMANSFKDTLRTRG